MFLFYLQANLFLIFRSPGFSGSQMFSRRCEGASSSFCTSQYASTLTDIPNGITRFSCREEFGLLTLRIDNFCFSIWDHDLDWVQIWIRNHQRPLSVSIQLQAVPMRIYYGSSCIMSEGTVSEVVQERRQHFRKNIKINAIIWIDLCDWNNRRMMRLKLDCQH